MISVQRLGCCNVIIDLHEGKVKYKQSDGSHSIPSINTPGGTFDDNSLYRLILCRQHKLSLNISRFHMMK